MEHLERIRERVMVKIDAADTLYLSSLRQFHGKTGIAERRLEDGSWVVRIMNIGETVIPRRLLRRV